ncbi:hypothetical protein PLICRDRAFT_47436 [Plicaturopsis crispa FD-325 SS-3]|uniref:FAD-dependent oxidoreductase 2 FAD-binding domain-containing protein n=1 Tax=Plicaturopsis crispa FD-325 SS-3 TaxID=944288 RepID=A0A0C9T4I7_PLICR|nr:hypothetical protein PLICRDRAFT_47436 [Plicaturopsis crispa FD-325 SS-3]
MPTFDCIVVGSGHAGSSAALSAVDSGCAKVLLIDKCPEEWAGGNGYFTAGAHRTVYGGLHDLLPIVHNVSAEKAGKIDIEPYTAAEFTSDIMRLGNGRPDPAVVKAVVESSRDAVQWLADRVKVPFTLAFNRQAYEVEGRQKFWGGLALSVQDGGKGLIAAHQRALKEAGVEIWFSTAATRILVDDRNAVSGLVVSRGSGESLTLSTKALILAAGGYESNAELRAKHLGPGWENARVRGTPYNTGDGFALATAIGARLTGDWQGCHSTTWDANAPAHQGDRQMSNQFTKSGYPLGIMVNSLGSRFVDEGEDFRNYTYAKSGRAVLAQPGSFAFQVWDANTIEWLRKEEYGDDVVEKIWAQSVDELAEKLVEKGLQDRDNFISTVRSYNAAVHLHRAAHPDLKWDPAVKDGLSTSSLPLPKSHWALPIERAPLMAVKIACGITFTFGGLAINPSTAAVISDETGEPIEGLFCTGEMVGGLFYGNYPGGSGLTAGAVFGRQAGRGAARLSAS